MDYRGCMGYGLDFSANQLGGPKKLWGIGEYGLPRLWVKRESTVAAIVPFLIRDGTSRWNSGFHNMRISSSKIFTELFSC